MVGLLGCRLLRIGLSGEVGYAYAYRVTGTSMHGWLSFAMMSMRPCLMMTRTLPHFSMQLLDKLENLDAVECITRLRTMLPDVRSFAPQSHGRRG